MQPENKMLFRGLTIQLLPYSSKYWETLAKWYYNNDYSDMFRQFNRVLTEDDFKIYNTIIQGEVFMIHSLEDNSIIGMIQSIPCFKKNKASFIGLVIDTSARGKHISNEAMYIFLDYLFNKHGLNKVIVEILESNSSLKSVLDKTGWYREGKLLQECFIDGKYQNELRYSMSAYYFNKNKDKYLKEYTLWVHSLKK